MDQFHKDDQIKLLDNENEKIAKTGSKGISKLALHCDTLDQGIEAFMQWLSSDDKMSASSNPIILKQFVHSKYTVLYDNTSIMMQWMKLMMMCHFAKVVIGPTAVTWGSPYSLNRNSKISVPYWINP